MDTEFPVAARPQAGARSHSRGGRPSPEFVTGGSRIARGQSGSIPLNCAEASVREAVAHPVAAVFELFEILVHIGMRDRPGQRIAHQVLLADVGDVIALVAFGEQVVERLVAIGPDVLGDRLIPVLAIREDRIDVEDHAAKVERLVSDHVADGEAREDAARRLESAAGLCGEKRCPVHE